MESDPAHAHAARDLAAFGEVDASADGVFVLPGLEVRIVRAHAAGEDRRAGESVRPRILSLDAHGRILDWIGWQDAACLYARDAVAWTLGSPCMVLHGGHNRLLGVQSRLELHPIVAARGHARGSAPAPSPALTNAALFARDAHLCLYCGREFGRHHLTRDHVQPLSRGGRDIWENVVSACIACNSHKGGRTPQQAGMPLLAVPYRPSWVEHLILSNRHILADQMAFLKSQMPKRDPRGIRIQ
ncbi:MAG: HNH endonuclease [Proteobacteria bacterium]|nr:HNH endonuclease [Pseudomonadota bacterium]